MSSIPSEALAAIFAARNPAKLDRLMDRIFGGTIGETRDGDLVADDFMLATLVTTTHGFAHMLERVRRRRGFPALRFSCTECGQNPAAPNNRRAVPPIRFVSVTAVAATLAVETPEELDRLLMDAFAEIDEPRAIDALLSMLVTTWAGFANTLDRFRRRRGQKALKLRCFECAESTHRAKKLPTRPPQRHAAPRRTLT